MAAQVRTQLASAARSGVATVQQAVPMGEVWVVSLICQVPANPAAVYDVVVDGIDIGTIGGDKALATGLVAMQSIVVTATSLNTGDQLQVAVYGHRQGLGEQIPNAVPRLAGGGSPTVLSSQWLQTHITSGTGFPTSGIIRANGLQVILLGYQINVTGNLTTTTGAGETALIEAWNVTLATSATDLWRLFIPGASFANAPFYSSPWMTFGESGIGPAPGDDVGLNMIFDSGGAIATGEITVSFAFTRSS